MSQTKNVRSFEHTRIPRLEIFSKKVPRTDPELLSMKAGPTNFRLENNEKQTAQYTGHFLAFHSKPSLNTQGNKEFAYHTKANQNLIKQNQ